MRIEPRFSNSQLPTRLRPITFMNRIKCYQCGLVNSVSDELCRRCRTNLHQPQTTPPKPAYIADAARDEPAKRSYLPVAIIIILIISIGGYAYFSLKLDIDQSEVKDKERVREESKRKARERELNESSNTEKKKVEFVKCQWDNVYKKLYPPGCSN